MTALRIVAPFRPFAPESALHQTLSDFDWMDALTMLVDTATRACQCPVHAITDTETVLPVPTLHYRTSERRLMLWTLEACLRYLESPDFDRDSVMLDVDQLVFEDLAPLRTPNADLTVLVRTTNKHRETGRLILNGVQFWSHSGRKRLVAFYRKALAVARTLPEASIQWGADSEALQILLHPIEIGALVQRDGLTVHFRDATDVLEAFSSAHAVQLAAGAPLVRSRAVLDFRYLRKRSMRPVYERCFQPAEMAS